MQHTAKNDVAEKLKQFNDVALIAEKLNSSEAYQSAFDEALKAEAVKLTDNGVALDLKEYQHNTKVFIQSYAPIKSSVNSATTINPNEEAPKDLAVFLKAVETDFEISEKIKRSNQYTVAFNSLLPNDIKEKALKKIQESQNHIYDLAAFTKQFNEKHSNLFPVFTIDPIARVDIEQYNKKQDIYKIFEIYQKMEKEDYAKSIKAIYQEQAENLGGLSDNYADNKFYQFKKILNESVDALSDEQRKEFTERFNKTFPNGFKTTKELNKEEEQANITKLEKIANDIEQNQKEYNTQVFNYLKTEQGNETARIKQTQYLQEMIIKEPQNFDRLSENFFTQNDLRNILPNENLLKLDNAKLLTSDKKATAVGAKKLTESLKTKIINSTIILAQSRKIGEKSIKSKEQLKAYYADKFRKEYVKAEKKLQMKRQNNKKMKLDSVKISY